MVGREEGISEANACIPKSSIHQSSVDFPPNARKKEAVKCEHFSIRGYVADIRRRNWKICWPFSPPGEIQGLEGQLSNYELPPLHVPKFRFWDCQKCIQRSDASNNAEDVSSVVLETICFGGMNAANTSVEVNGTENCQVIDSAERENKAITMPEIGQGAVNLNLEACTVFGGTTCGIASNGEPKLARTLQNFENADVISFRRRKFRPCESSDDEDEYVDNLHGQVKPDQPGDSSQITSFKRTRKSRLLSDIPREKKSGVSAEISNSDWGTNFGDVSTKIDQTKSLSHPDRLAICDQTYVGNGIEEKNKKRKALRDEDHNILLKRFSKGLAKNIYQRDLEENGFGCSDGLYSNGESHFPENGKHTKVSQNHIDNKETLSEDRCQQHNVTSCQGFANIGSANNKMMNNDREVENDEVPTSHQGFNRKRGFEEKHSMRAKQKNTCQIQIEACPITPKDLSFPSNSKKKKNLDQAKATRSQSNDCFNKMDNTEALDDISLEVMEVLAESRHERRCQEAQKADQIKLSVLEKSVNVKNSGNVSSIWEKKLKKIHKTCKTNIFGEKQMQQSLDKKSSLVSSSRSNHFGGTQFGEAVAGDKQGDLFCMCDRDKLVNEKAIYYSQSSTSHPNHQMISHSKEMLEPNQVSGQIREGNDLLPEQPCACTQKKIDNFAKPDIYTNRYMPATELLQLMDAGMCPTVQRGEKLNQLPIQIADCSKEQLPLSYGSTMNLSKQELSNCFNKDDSNSGLYCYSSGPIMPPVYPVQKHDENSTLSRRINKSQVVLETAKSARWGKGKNSLSSLEMDCELKKPSWGNEDLGEKHDPFSTKVSQSKLGSSSLEPRLTYDSNASVGVGDKVATLQHTNWNFGIEICCVNRNPADFTVPAPGNRFMIGRRHLKMGKMISKRGRPRKGIMEVPNLDKHAHS